MNTSMITTSEQQTEAIGEKIAAYIQPGDTILLYGEPGAGKTVLVRGIARGLGVFADVHSPTFTIVNEYPLLRGKLIHMDLYRLDRQTIWNAGLEEYFDGSNICIVEWPNDLNYDGEALIVRMGYFDEKREIVFSVQGNGKQRWEGLANAFVGD